MSETDAVAALRAAHARDAPQFAIKSVDAGFCGVCTWRGHTTTIDTPAPTRADAEQQLAELMLAAHGGCGGAANEKGTLIGTATTCASRKNGVLVARVARRGGTATLAGKLASTARALGHSAVLRIYAAPAERK